MSEIYQFTDAIISRDLFLAEKIASQMNAYRRLVAREIWLRWVSDNCPF